MQDISRTIGRINATMAMLQILAVNVQSFDDMDFSYSVEYSGITINVYPDYDGDKNLNNAAAKMLRIARVLKRAMKGSVIEKDYSDYYFTMVIRHPENARIRFSVRTNRENACHQVVVPGEFVETKVVDYDAAPFHMETKPKLEWKCDPILEGAE